MFLHGYDHSSLLSHLDAKCLPTKYGGLMDIETDQGIDLWNLLCYYEGNYQGTVDEIRRGEFFFLFHFFISTTLLFLF